MSDQTLHISDFVGGISQADRIGPAGSAAFLEKLDFTANPNELTLQLAGSKASGATVT